MIEQVTCEYAGTRVIDVEALRCGDVQVMTGYAQVADDAFNLPAEYGMEFVGLFVEQIESMVVAAEYLLVDACDGFDAQGLLIVIFRKRVMCERHSVELLKCAACTEPD